LITGECYAEYAPGKALSDIDNMSTPAQHTYQSSAPWWVVAAIVSVGVALSLSVILALTWWREKQVDQHLHVAATQAATLAADAINAHLQHQRHLLELFTREHAAALDAVIAAPGDARLEKALETATLGYFPDAFAHTLSSADGTILLENLEGLVGERCRENIRTFAATSNQHLVLHPNPLKPHYDVMTQYGRHVLFVSFQPGPLSALLTKHQPEMVKLMIVQRHGSLIEISSEGDRSKLTREARLSAEEHARLLASTEIPLTEWRIVGIPDSKALAAEKQAIRNQSMLMLLGLVLLVVIFQLRYQREHHARLQAEENAMEMANLGLIDALTGLPNRRALDADMKREWLNMQRANEPLSFLMIDLDHFKQFNDTYGHLAGDHCLRLVAQAMRTTLKRPRDRIARFGGEEFVMLLPNTTCLAAKLLADALHESVHEAFVEAEGSEVTISIGSTCAHAGQISQLNDLIELADKALYAAKDAGRNTTVVIPAGSDSVP
jgi:diguanylate cyclase (GGDEF)-like protein